MHNSIDRQINRLKGTEKAEDTVREYERALKEYSKWLTKKGIEPEEVNALMIEDYLAYLSNVRNLSSSSIRIKHAALSYYYRNLKKGSIINEVPTENAELSDYAPVKTEREKATDEKRIFFSRKQLEKVVRNVPAPSLRNRLLILFQYYTALRRQEVADVKLSDLDLEERRVKVCGKGDKTNVAHWQPRLDPLLKKYIDGGYRDASPYSEKSEYLFVTPKTPQIDGQTINGVVVKAAENAGIQEIIYTDARGAEHNKYTSHTLRHSFAMHWLDNGGSMEALSKHLAHSSITTTEIYGEIREDRASKEYEEFAPDLNTDTSYQGGVCILCNDRPSSVSHHTSYNPEETIDVCPSCHAEIHHTNKYEDLQPDMTLKQAKKEGHIN